jgi:hypothetical protein
VQADEYARDCNERRPGEEKRANSPPAYQGDGEGDGEGGDCMIARK